MKAVIIAKPKELVVREIPAPRPGPYEALVRMELCAICNSTDTKLKDGHFPGFTTYPATLGHEGIGTVVETGAKVVSFKPGDRVLNPCTMQTGIPGLASGWGTMAEFALAGDHAAMAAAGVCDAAHGWDGVFQTQKVIPPDISNRQAILLSTWREVWSSFSDFYFRPGQSVFVFGGGPVGLSFVRLAKCFGMGRVGLATRSRWKLDKARTLGADEVFRATDDVIEQVKKAIPELFDVVVDAVGSPTVINQALQLVKFNGVVGVYGTVPEMQLPLDKSHVPYNWKLVLHQWPDYALEAAAHEPLCALIRAGRISAGDYITHEFSFEEIEKGFAALGDNQALKVILHFPHPA